LIGSAIDRIVSAERDGPSTPRQVGRVTPDVASQRRTFAGTDAHSSGS